MISNYKSLLNIGSSGNPVYFLNGVPVQCNLSSNSTNVSASMAEMMHSKQQLVQVIKYGVMLVSTLPVIIVYPFLQKYFVKGVMVGSLKG